MAKVKINGKDIHKVQMRLNKDYGQWRITDLKYPDELYDDGLINIELTAHDKIAAESSNDEDWKISE